LLGAVRFGTPRTREHIRRATKAKRTEVYGKPTAYIRDQSTDARWQAQSECVGREHGQSRAKRTAARAPRRGAHGGRPLPCQCGPGDIFHARANWLPHKGK
jgi:hypothetical protein